MSVVYWCTVYRSVHGFDVYIVLTGMLYSNEGIEDCLIGCLSACEEGQHPNRISSMEALRIGILNGMEE